MSAKPARGGLFKRLLRPIKRLLGKRSDVASRGAAAVAAHVDEPLVDEAFQLEIDRMRTEDDGRFQVKLQIISLIEFREGVGEKWSRVAEKVLMIAEGVIHRHLGAGNVFSRQGQDFFVLLFRACPPAEGRRRALAIAQELGTRLVGNQFQGLDRPLALAAELPLEDACHPDGTLNMAAIHASVSEMRALLAATAAEEGPKVRHSMLPGEKVQAPTQLPRHLRPSAGGGPGDREISHSLLPGDLPIEPLVFRPAVLPGHGPRPKPGGVSGEELPPDLGPDPGWTPIEAEARKAKGDPSWQAMEHKSAAPKGRLVVAPPMSASVTIRVAWRPTWVAEGEAIAVYKAQIQRTDRPGETPLEGSAAYPADGAGTAALDRTVIAAAARELNSPEGAAETYKVIAPLHWASLKPEHRTTVITPLAYVAEAVRQARLVIEIFGVSDGVTAEELHAVAGELRPLCGEVTLRQPLGAPQAAAAAECGMTAIGLDLTELAPAERTDDAHLLLCLLHFQDVAGRLGLRTYIWGARRRKLVIGAVQGGFDMVSGPALMRDLPRPGKVLPAPKSRFV